MVKRSGFDWGRFGLVAIDLLVFSNAFADSDKIRFVTQNPELGFNYPYFLRLPDDSHKERKSVLIVETNNSGLDDNFDNQINAAREFVSSYGIGPATASTLNQPLLVPVLPRTESEWELYTHALDRDTLVTTDKTLQRIDKQLMRMIEHAQNLLDEEGLLLHNKVVFCGFSASGTFANRIAFLHPDKVMMVVAGGINAFPMLPVAEIDEMVLNYPLGVADLGEFTGAEFKTKAWGDIPQYLFMGALDDNDAVAFDDAYSDAERAIIHTSLGDDMMKRWLSAQNIYLDIGANVTFTTYGRVGHFTDGRIANDVSNFVASHLREIE